MLQEIDEWAQSDWPDSAPSIRLGAEDLEVVLAEQALKNQLQQGTRARLARSIRGVRHLDFPDRSALDHPQLVFSHDGYSTYPREFESVVWRDFVAAHPVRDYSRHRGQKNKPIAFFSRTTGDLVNCESRLERSFALVADFDPRVVHIAAQPCAIQFPISDDLKVHTVDFIVLALGHVPIAVDVKPLEEAMDPKWITRHERVRQLLAGAGIAHVVWTGLASTVIENIAYLSASTAPTRMLDEVRVEAVRLSEGGVRAGKLSEMLGPSVGEWPATNGRQALPIRIAQVLIRGLLWERTLVTDLTIPFSSNSPINSR